MKFNNLTPEEEHIIIYKGTEPPFSGIYEKHFEGGVYVCRRCDKPLYLSENKFDAGCGWPSFDDEIEGSVRRLTDLDGKRTEIVCASCGGHLGHVFKGEGHTPKDTRHCVNSVSIKFRKMQELSQIVLGGGCFWCVEAAFSALKGIMVAMPGYAGGIDENPTYEKVCGGKSGHAEVVRLIFDPAIITLRDILDVFFNIHDPTTVDRQGDDVGSQYRSIIFYSSDATRDQAMAAIGKLKGEFDAPIVTEVLPFKKFHEAEGCHRNYFAKNPDKPYCTSVIAPKMEQFTRHYRQLLSQRK